jgi:hypothetical protein
MNARTYDELLQLKAYGEFESNIPRRVDGVGWAFTSLSRWGSHIVSTGIGE